MNDLEQYEVNALREDARLDACEDANHPYPRYTKTYDDGAKAVVCSECGQCAEFIEA